MRISVMTLDGTTFAMQVPPDIKLSDFRRLCARELKWPEQELLIIFEGKPLVLNNEKLSRLNIKHDDLVVAQKMRSMQGRNSYMGFDGGNVDMSNLESVRAQRRIEDAIRQQNIDSNMEMALEHLPEAFASVTMLYIACKVNGHSVKAFVDSGAQMTIISKSCAERCGLIRLLDKRFQGEARGVGVQKILGRIHLAQVEISGSFFTSSFCVLEGQQIDILIGLDLLRRHQCVIDLEKNALFLRGVDGRTVRANFLSERELPDFARNSVYPEADSTESFPPATIDDLMQTTSCTREEVLHWLRNHNGCVEKAKISLLLSKLNTTKKS